MRISRNENYSCWLCPCLTVQNLLPNEDKLTIRVCSGDHSWSFLIILAMTMTMTINSNSVLLIRVASAGQYESFEHVQKFCVPSSAQYEYFSFVVMCIETMQLSFEKVELHCFFTSTTKISLWPTLSH